MEYILLQNKSTGFKNLLKRKCEEADTIYFASAFIDKFTIDFLRDMLSWPVTRRPRIKFITGLFGRFNCKADLIALEKLNKHRSKVFQIRISELPAFHWKYYGFESKSSLQHIVGSSNFTKNGLTSEGEFLVEFNERTSFKEKSKLLSMFNDEFNQAIDISLFNLSAYIERKRTIDKTNDLKIIDLLNQSKKYSNETRPAKHSFRIIKFQASLSPKVEKKVMQEKSLWEKKNWSLYAFYYKSDFNAAWKAKYLLNIYKAKGQHHITLEEIVDKDEISVGGDKYFIATRTLKDLKLTVHKENELKSIGVSFKGRPNNWQAIYPNKSLSKIIQTWFDL